MSGNYNDYRLEHVFFVNGEVAQLPSEERQKPLWTHSQRTFASVFKLNLFEIESKTKENESIYLNIQMYGNNTDQPPHIVIAISWVREG